MLLSNKYYRSPIYRNTISQYSNESVRWIMNADRKTLDSSGVSHKWILWNVFQSLDLKKNRKILMNEIRCLMGLRFRPHVLHIHYTIHRGKSQEISKGSWEAKKRGNINAKTKIKEYVFQSFLLFYFFSLSFRGLSFLLIEEEILEYCKPFHIK